MAWEWVGPVTTAAVGIAGVAGTVWTANRGRRSQIELLAVQGKVEFERSLVVEKRVLYSKYLRTIEQNIDLAENIFRAKRDVDMLTAGERVNLATNLDAKSVSNSELAALRTEIAVLGGPQMGALAGKLNSLMFAYDGGGEYGQLNGVMERLVSVMNIDIDLSEPFRKETLERLFKRWLES